MEKKIEKVFPLLNLKLKELPERPALKPVRNFELKYDPSAGDLLDQTAREAIRRRVVSSKTSTKLKSEEAWKGIPDEVVEFEGAVAVTMSYAHTAPFRKRVHWIYEERENELALPFTKDKLMVHDADRSESVVKQIKNWEESGRTGLDRQGLFDHSYFAALVYANNER